MLSPSLQTLRTYRSHMLQNQPSFVSGFCTYRTQHLGVHSTPSIKMNAIWVTISLWQRPSSSYIHPLCISRSWPELKSKWSYSAAGDTNYPTPIEVQLTPKPIPIPILATPVYHGDASLQISGVLPGISVSALFDGENFNPTEGPRCQQSKPLRIL